MQNKKIFIVAGELSSDTHAANLIQAIKSINPNVEFYGLGGQKMQEAGAKIYHNLVDLAVVGFFEVLKNLSTFKKIFKDALTHIDEIKPDAVILIDYPGFNLRLAKEVKKRNIKVIYYISPQVWAWGKERIKLIKKCVDKILVIFKFEEGFYKKHGVDATFVGHPLMEILPKYVKETCEDKIALLPGSRKSEITKILPIMLRSAKIIQETFPYLKFILIKSPTVEKTLFDKCLKNYPYKITIVEKNHYEELSRSKFALVASGTATVETAILGVPFIIVYKVNPLTAFALKVAIKIPYVGMVNILAGKKIIEEFLQEKALPKNIAEYIIQTLNNPTKLSKIKEDLKIIRPSLGDSSASYAAARIILHPEDRSLDACGR